MRKKIVTLAFVSLFFLSVMLVTRAIAQPRIVGVNLGDWFKTGNITVDWSSGDPNATFPPSGYEWVEEINETEYYLISVQDVSGTNITLQTVAHYKDGTEETNFGHLDIDTGEGNMSLLVISANLVANDTIYASSAWSDYKINETLVRAYADGVRETNHMKFTKEISFTFNETEYYYYHIMNYYWDRSTGILVETSYESIIQVGEFLTSLSFSNRITESNVWVVTEIFPKYTLTVHSSPSGVTFAVDGVPHTTPWSGIYVENASVSLVMAESHDGYVWSHWFEDGDTNRTKVVTVDTNATLTGVFTFIPSSANIDIDPDTLNLKSKGRWITCYIELPEGYDVNDINRTTTFLNDTIPVDPFWVDKPLESVVEDFDNDTIPDLMVKFSRSAVVEYILSQNRTHRNVTLTVAGELHDSTSFEASDVIRVKMPNDAENVLTEAVSEVNSDNEKMLVMPEFPSLLILPLFIIATLLTVVYAKKRKKT